MGQSPTLRLKVGLLVVSVLTTFIAMEAVIRLFVPMPRWKIQGSWELWNLDPVLGWTMKPSITHYSTGGWILSTNADGLQPSTAVRPRNKDVRRILLVGDSTVAGIGVPPTDTLNAKLEKALRAKGMNVEVYNAAVEGYSTDQSLLRLQQLLPLYSPDVVLYGFCTNDLEGNVSGEQYSLSKPRFVLEGSSLVLIPPTQNKTVPDFRAPYARLLQSSALFGLLRPTLVRIRNQFRASPLAEDPSSTPESLEKFDWRLFAKEVSMMKDAAKNAGAEFAFFSHPSIPEVWASPLESSASRSLSSESRPNPFVWQRKLADLSHANQIPFVPLIEHFLANRARGPFHLLPNDPHSNAAGYELIAERLAQYLEGR